MEYSIKELRQKTREIVDLAESGQSITITYRGKKKAKVVPLYEDIGASKAGFGMWSDREEMQDSSKYVQTVRQGRFRDH